MYINGVEINAGAESIEVQNGELVFSDQRNGIIKLSNLVSSGSQTIAHTDVDNHFSTSQTITGSIKCIDTSSFEDISAQNVSATDSCGGKVVVGTTGSFTIFEVNSVPVNAASIAYTNKLNRFNANQQITGSLLCTTDVHLTAISSTSITPAAGMIIYSGSAHYAYNGSWHKLY
jgi:hypothetical protein